MIEMKLSGKLEPRSPFLPEWVNKTSKHPPHTHTKNTKHVTVPIFLFNTKFEVLPGTDNEKKKSDILK